MMATCLGIVLAGGLSSRMGSDKAQLMRQQQKMIDFSQQRLQQAGVDQVVISGDKYGVPDRYKNAGPLSGVYSVLSQHACSAVIILPVDLPLITVDAIKQLKHMGQLTQKACFYQNHAIPMYLPINSFTELFFTNAFDHFSGKGPSVRALLDKVPHQALPLTDERILMNTNTPQEWQQAQHILSTSFKKPLLY